MQIFINKVLHDASKPAESRQECLAYVSVNEVKSSIHVYV